MPRTGHAPLLRISHINRATIREAANYNAWSQLEACPSHGMARIRDIHEYPSMMGYGSDTSVRLSCGCFYTDTPMGMPR